MKPDPPQEHAQLSASPWRLWPGAVLLFVALGYFPHFWPHFHTANEAIRFYFVESVVDQHSPYVDGVMQRHRTHNVDRAVHKGQSTLDKAPGLSYLAMPLYLVLTRLGLSRSPDQVHTLYFIICWLVVGGSALLGLYFLYGSALWLTESPRSALLATALVGLASPYALYATLFFGHVPATACFAASLAYALRCRALPAGLWAGVMVLCDTPTALLALALGVAICVRSTSPRWPVLLRYVGGGLPFALLQLAHNAWLFGNPFVFSYAHKADATFAALHGQGLFGFTAPSATRLWGITLGSQRGLLFHAPVLTLGIVGLVLVGPGRRGLRRTLLLLVGGYLVFIGSFVDWRAGDSYAARHLTPLLPLLGLGIAGLLSSSESSPLLRACRTWLLGGLAFASFLLNWAPIATFPYAPQTLQDPLSELAWPLLVGRQTGSNWGKGLGMGAGYDLLPLLFILILLAVWLTRTVGGGRFRLLLTSTIVGLAVSLLVFAGRPEERYRVRATRSQITCLLGYSQKARVLCESAAGAYFPARCSCRFPRSWRDLPLRTPQPR